MASEVLRVFVSSPGDVAEERRRIDLVVERLNTDFATRVRVECIRWETSYYSAHETFQQQIPEAADCDVVIAVFRARLGTPLPPEFPRLPSGEAYPSGTAYEVLSAIEARKAGKPLPDVYVFRYPSAPSVPLDAPDRAEIEAQWGRLKAFFDHWFRSKSGEFIAAFQSYSSTDDFAAKVEDCLRQWLSRRGFLPQGLLWDRVLRGSPFPGLSAFEADRGTVFFGRSLAIAQTLARLRQAGAGGSRLPFLLIIGASGSGKSSLLRAGLLPRLILPGTIPEIDLWRTAIVAPGPDPFLSLAEALFAPTALGAELQQGAFRSKDLLAKQLAGDLETAVAPVRAALERAAAVRKQEADFDTARPARVALAIDQAERLFIEMQAETAAAFAGLLAALVRQNLTYVMMTLRSDAYARFQGVEALVGLREAGATFDLVPPTAAELEEIVTQPVAACQPRLAFEEKDGRSLASLLVADAKGGDALPLLQMTMSRLYGAEEARGDGVLRFADYRGMDAAVTETANEVLQTLGEAARNELPALVTALVSDVSADPLTGALTPVVAALDRTVFEAKNPARRVLVEAFVDRRLLTAEGDGVHERVRPVHEALLRIWPQAVAIVHENAALIRVRHTLESMVRGWNAATPESKASYLELSPALLDGAQHLLARFADDLPPAMRDFITQAAATDAARRDRERQEQEQRLRDAQELAAANRRIARRTGIGLVAALALVVVAVWQWWIARTETAVAQTQTQVAERQTRRAEELAHVADAQRDRAIEARSRALAAVAAEQIDNGDAATGLLIALEAADQHPTPDVEAALINGQLHLREAAVLMARSNQVNASVFSRDGRLILNASSRWAEVWETKTGKRLAVLSGHRGTINNAVFSPDGTRVATASDDGTARLWEARSGKPLLVLKGHTGPVVTVAFSPDGTRLVTASQDKTARIWNTRTGETSAVLAGHGAALTGAVFSPDGKLVLTTSKDRTARTWNSDTGAVVAQFSGPGDDVWPGAFSADGKRVVTPSLDGTAAVWESATGKLIVLLKGHADRVFTAEFIPGTDEVVTASYDKTARIWDARTGATINILAGHQGIVMTARPSPDGRYIVTASTDKTARIWDVATGRVIAVLGGHTDWVLNAVFGPDDERVLTAGRDGTARLWVNNSLTIYARQRTRPYQIWRAAISPDGTRIAAPSANHTARIWNADNGRLIAILRGHTAGIDSVAFDATGRRVLTAADDDTARIWDAETGRQLAVLSGHQNSVVIGAFSPDGTRVVTGSVDHTARVWDARTGKQLLVISGHRGPVARVAFSPDGKRIVTASLDQTVRLWDAATGKPAGPGILWHNLAWGVAFSPDGKRIALSDLWVTILDTRSGDVVASYPGFAERVLDLAYTADGRYLLLASMDGTARIWDAHNGHSIAFLDGFDGGVRSIGVSANGRKLFTASGAQTLRIWHVVFNAAASVSDIKAIVPRCLTPAERADFNLPAAAPEWCFGADKWPYRTRAWKIWHQHRNDTKKLPLPDTPEFLEWVAKTGAALAVKRPTEAIVYLEETVDIFQGLAADDPRNPRWPTGIAAALTDLSRAHKALAQPDAALRDLEKARALLLEETEAHPRDSGLREYLAYVYELLGDALLSSGKRAQGLDDYRLALAVRTKLAAAEPEDLTRQRALAYDYQKLAEELDENGAEALDRARDNLAIRRKLAAGARDKPDLQETVAYALRLMADVLLAHGKRPEAIAAYRECLEIRQQLARAEPNNPMRQNNVAFVEERLAKALLPIGQTQEVLTLYKQALAIWRKLAAAHPEDLLRQKDVASAEEHVAAALDAEGRRSDAVAYYRDTIATRRKIAARLESEETRAHGKPGAGTATELGNLSWDAIFVSDFPAALDASSRAVKMAPNQLWLRTNYAHALMFLGRTEEARAVYRQFCGKATFKGILWQQSVLEDFAAFRKAGLVSNFMGEVEKMFRAEPQCESPAG